MLASMLMESALGLIPDVSPEYMAKYNHEDAPMLIAIESAEDINEIFNEGFYAMEALEFSKAKATMEGASDEVLEGIVGNLKTKAGNAIKTIKEKLKALWEKVKAFFANTKKLLTAIFGNAAKFAKAHEKELKALKLNGFKAEAFKYTFDKGFDKSKVIESAAERIGSLADKATKDTTALGNKTESGVREEYSDLIKASFGGSEDESSISDFIWGSFRNGAKSTADKITVQGGDFSGIVDALIGSPKLMNDFESNWKAMDKIFKNAITKCQAAEKLDAEKYPNMVKAFSEYHSMITKLNNLNNKIVSYGKGAVKEMVSSYRGIMVKAMRYKPAKD